MEKTNTSTEIFLNNSEEGVLYKEAPDEYILYDKTIGPKPTKEKNNIKSPAEKVLEKYLNVNKQEEKEFEENFKSSTAKVHSYTLDELRNNKLQEQSENYIGVKKRRLGSKNESSEDFKPFPYMGIPETKPKKVVKEKPEIIINKDEELIINIEELADELAIENQKDKNNNKEYVELLKKYKTIILKHERTKKE